MHLYILQLTPYVRNSCWKSTSIMMKEGKRGKGKRNVEIYWYVAGLNHCKDILEEPYLQLRFSVLRVSVPSPVVTAAANLHTLRSPSFQPLHSPRTWTMDTQDPTAATATGMGMEPGTLSTTTQQDFMLTMAVMETDPCQARWEASASVLHTGEDWLHEREELSWQVREELDVWRKMHNHGTEVFPLVSCLDCNPPLFLFVPLCGLWTEWCIWCLRMCVMYHRVTQ